MLSWSLMAVLSGVVVGFVGAGSAGATPSSPDGELVMVGSNLTTRDYGHDGLYTVNADGSSLRQVTHSSSDGDPHWSPDGRWIAYETETPTRGLDAVAIVRGDGTGRRVVGRGGYWGNLLDASSPWSPDGKELVWSGCGGLCVVDVSTRRKQHIRLGGGGADSFAWAPNGHELAASESGGGPLVVVDAVRRVVRGVLAADAGSPAWSADGRELAFLTARGELEVMSASGGAPREIATNVLATPSWSPHGHLLLFVTRRTLALSRVEVSDLVRGERPRTIIADSAGNAGWGPDGSQVVFTRDRWPGGGEIEPDVWTVSLDGQGERRVTDAFPTGVQYSDPEWAAASLPPAETARPALLTLEPSALLQLDWTDGSLVRAGTPDSVGYDEQTLCDADAETTSSSFSVWAPTANTIATTTTDCQDFATTSYAISPTLVDWLVPDDIGFNATVSVIGWGTATAEGGQWSDSSDDPDIGYRDDLYGLLGDGSTLYFESANTDRTWSLWRIAGGSPSHAIDIPVPPDATGAADAADGQIALSTAGGGLVVITRDGTVVSRVAPTSAPGERPAPQATARLGDDTVGVLSGTTLRVYRTDDASPLAQLPVASAAGQPQLLSINDDYAVYESGIELHLLQLHDGLDRILDLPGEAGPVDALLTSTGLFVSYDQAYETEPGRLLYIPATNLPWTAGEPTEQPLAH